MNTKRTFTAMLSVAALVIGSSAQASPSTALEPPQASQSPLLITEGMTPPVKIHHIKPAYPEEARKAGVEGMVVLEVIIDELGGVKVHDVLRSAPEFDSSARETVEQWKYRPALLGCEFVPVYMVIKMRYALHEERVSLRVPSTGLER